MVNSLSLVRATLESTTDGILVTNGSGPVTGFNEKFLEMWRLPREAVDSRAGPTLRASLRSRPEQFLSKIKDIRLQS